MKERQKIELESIKDAKKKGIVHDNDFYFFKRFINKNNITILDIGANRGQSIVSFKNILPGARILSFEANPIFYPILEEVASWYDKVKVYGFGVGSVDKQLRMSITVVDSFEYLEEGSIDPDEFDKAWVKERLHSYGKHITYKKINVNIRTLESQMLDFDIEIVKIDVEGAELDVLMGMNSILQKNNPVFMIENSDYDKITNFLRRKGYDS